ncbi:hypothetical protein GJ496_004272 [Pomphorhynchus laevis]|nr:hypothetical protein GJ496_004272 [Pomphorhynchus laevis]
MQDSQPQCIVIGCPNMSHCESVRYYKLPIENEHLSQQWYSNTLREDLVPDGYHYVCHEHFDVDSFEDDQRTLRSNAIPSLFELEIFHKMLAHQDIIDAADDQEESKPNRSYRLSKDDIGRMLDQEESGRECASGVYGSDARVNMMSSADSKSLLLHKPPPDNHMDAQLKVLKCSIMGCSNHYMPKRRAVPLYNLPRDDVLAKRWLKACRREDVQFQSYTRFRICKNHFQADDFDNDGNLKSTSIPSLFSPRSLDMQIHLRNMNLRKRKEKIVDDENEVYSTNKIVPAHLSKRAAALRGSKLAIKRRKAQQRLQQQKAADWKVAYDNLSKHDDGIRIVGEDRIKDEPLELTMTCEDDGLSQSQIAALQSRLMANPHTRNLIAANELSMDCLLSQQNTVSEDTTTAKVESTERCRRSSIYRSNTRYSTLPNLRRSRQKRNTQKVIIYVRPKATAKASIPFLEPAFKEQHRPFSKNLCVPRLKPGAVRTREEGLEIHLERTFRTSLKKYYDRKWSISEPHIVSTPAACQCIVCSDIVPDNIALASHLNAISQISCSICNQVFSTPFDMIMHYDVSHIHDRKEYQCRICEQKHSSLLELAAHLNLCHCGLEMPYRCEQCEFRTSFHVDALHHIATFHRGEDRFFCPFCLNTHILPPMDDDTLSHNKTSVVLNSASAYAHLIQHYDKIDGTKYISSKCKHCRKCVLHLKMIKDHIRRDHPNIVAGAKANYFSDDEVDEKYLIASGAITTLSATDFDGDMPEPSLLDPNLIDPCETLDDYYPRNNSINKSEMRSRRGRKKNLGAGDLVDHKRNRGNKISSCSGPQPRHRGRPWQVTRDPELFDSFQDDDVEDQVCTQSDIGSTTPRKRKSRIKRSARKSRKTAKKPMLRCIECGKMLDQTDSHHFRSSRRCAFCPYTSCCSAAFAIHEQGHHEQTLYTLETVDPDLVAFHMATAQIGGKPSDNSLAGSVPHTIDARGRNPDCAHACMCIPL